jgi:hypothetical protein
MMTISRDVPDPAPAPTVTLLVHYYGSLGVVVDTSGGGSVVRMLTNRHVSAARQ